MGTVDEMMVHEPFGYEGSVLAGSDVNDDPLTGMDSDMTADVAGCGGSGTGITGVAAVSEGVVVTSKV